MSADEHGRELQVLASGSKPNKMCTSMYLSYSASFLKMLLIPTLLLCVIAGAQAVEHPSIMLTAEEAAEIRQSLGKYPLFDASYEMTMAAVQAAMAVEIEIPPPGEGGGYEHERHKQNYRDMRDAGLLYAITAEPKYAEFVKQMLDGYAELYPTLGAHPLSKKQVPGKLFHQVLNENVWLSNTAIAYDCVYDWLREEDRQKYETNIFEPMVEWITVKAQKDFDRIHNHGTWCVASVGMIGFVMDRPEWVDMSLYGTDLSGKGGFLKQIDMLFSPDGYYMEGPYYIRYAIRPLFKFAEALERHRPELKIYQYRDSMLEKVYFAAVGMTFPNGVFAPINDASRTMNIQAPGVVRASALVFDRYSSDERIFALAGIQGQTILSGSGLKLAKAMSQLDSEPPFALTSVEYRDGYDGKQGGLGILRHGEGDKQAVLMMKYGVHGMGHGHFDKLHFIYFNQGREIIPDYGFARWINVEPKFGGRYLPENNSYAKQTIAHNTVVVDGISQNNGDRKAADKVSAQRHFFDNSDPRVQVMSARANDHYDGVNMQRSMLLIEDDRLDYPLVVDIYRVESASQHQYDYPIHFRGRLVTTSFESNAATSQLTTLGEDHGYQHIWKTAEAAVSESAKLTWLDGNRYYSLTTAAQPNATLMFGRTGANDPNFNLYSEPLAILRMQGSNVVFASAIEAHGYFKEASETSRNARGTIESVEVLAADANGTVILMTGKNDYRLKVMVTNAKADAKKKRKVRAGSETFRWTGNYNVNFE